MFTKYFTPYEANKRLPLIKKIVAEILQNGQALQNLVRQDPSLLQSAEGLKREAEVEALLRELEELGCFYKDWNFQMGLVDFPSVINGKEVFLCWRSDEEGLQWYHDVTQGYSDRQPIPVGLLSLTESAPP